MGQAGGQAQGPGGIAAFMPLIILFVIFYFLLIRPQQKRAKEHKAMVSNLKKGDRVITSGGIHGTIASLDETTLTLEIAEKTKIKVNRGNVAGLAGGSSPETTKEDTKKDKKKE
ncbi:MAG: preprotein translocase subunit YajC [Desulfarculaceae bacterium]|nr:preprotein translocase subunit YajC [Desulfarculaceae bacterium]